MRALFLCFGLGGALAAQAPLCIVAVERKGPPPYEVEDRIYRLDGGADRGLRPGHRLAVRHPGEPRPLGHLRISEVRGAEAEARFEPIGTRYPMKGDLASHEELAALPALPVPDAAPVPMPAGPGPVTEAPPQEGLLFFLPQRADLSPMGLQKLQAWIGAWGAAGRWEVQIPASRAIKPMLQKQRALSLLTALRALGVGRATVDGTPRAIEGKYDPAWVRHWD